MAGYFAVIKTEADGAHIQQNVYSGQLEIYEEREQAEKNCPEPKSYSVVEVDISRKIEA